MNNHLTQKKAWNLDWERSIATLTEIGRSVRCEENKRGREKWEDGWVFGRRAEKAKKIEGRECSLTGNGVVKEGGPTACDGRSCDASSWRSSESYSALQSCVLVEVEISSSEICSPLTQWCREPFFFVMCETSSPSTYYLLIGRGDLSIFKLKLLQVLH